MKSNKRALWVSVFVCFALAIFSVVAEERPSESAGPSASIVDVRELIKDALNVMRAYPTPQELVQTPVQMNPIVNAPAPLQPLPPAPSQQQAPVYYPRRASGVTTYNGGVISDVDRRYGVMADSQQPSMVQQMSRWFATPTKQDMERLFHLPADIVTRIAADAGYIKPNEEEVHNYASSLSSSSSSSDSGGMSSFDFNLSGHGDNAKDLQAFIASLQNPTAAAADVPATSTSTQAPVIPVAGPPKITTRQVMRDGKLVAIPFLIIPQPNGQPLQIPFHNMQELSHAVNRIISTGRFQVTTTAAPTVEPVETMPTIPADVQVEPTTRAPKQSPPTATGGGDSPFVQQFDEDSTSSSVSSSSSTAAPTTSASTQESTTESTTNPLASSTEKIVKKTIEKTAAEIVLDGRRYKLVAVESTEEVQVPASSSTSKSTPSSTTTTTTAAPAAAVVRTTEARTFHVEEEPEPSASAEEEKTTEGFRPPTLRELEERYNRENALATRGGDEPEEETTAESSESSDRLLRHHRTRLLSLRTPIAIRKPKPGETIKTHSPSSSRCAIIRAFAHKFEVHDLRTFALEHCDFLEHYDPSLRCSEVAAFVTTCERELLH